MITQISFKQIAVSDSLKAYAAEKSEKLNKYFHGRINITWNFTTEKHARVAHCHVVGNKMDFFGQGETQDFRASVDEAVDKVEKQLRKRKEQVKDHLHKHRQAG